MNRTNQLESQNETETIGGEISAFMTQIKDKEIDAKSDAMKEIAEMKAKMGSIVELVAKV